ncbi:hypothetical protein M3Y99_01668500 [Aphelenchoides fujianensis]|nr:hypothetical protein M3Y99_01668500 [Aphelenchoides fujianensis]
MNPPTTSGQPPMVVASAYPTDPTDVHRFPGRPLPTAVAFAPRPPPTLHQRLMVRSGRSPRLPKTKSFQKRRYGHPHRLEELRQALDLTKYIEQVQNLINQPIKIPSTVSACMNRKSKPGERARKPKDDLLSVKDVWRDDEQRHKELKTVFNTEDLGEREFLLKLLLDESDEDSGTDEVMTEEELRHMIRIHRKRRQLQKKYHDRTLNAQYTYYAAGMLSEQDRFPDHQKAVLALKDLIDK